jgi:predicted NBD/HSP70 family sugar kinase
VGAELMTGEEADQLLSTDPDRAIYLLAEAAARGSPRALAALNEAGTALGRAIDDIIGTTNPDAVILGGYLGVLGPFLLPGIEPGLVQRLSVDAYASTRVLIREATERDVVLGATLAARDACLYDPLTWTKPLPR